ncbi:hypothetical protein EYV94_12985 [Puteibacter caeruleilacunae]|nr:hypothetical protein EYV94_12985 [Puteibacter caeruleilacunae]
MDDTQRVINYRLISKAGFSVRDNLEKLTKSEIIYHIMQKLDIKKFADVNIDAATVVENHFSEKKVNTKSYLEESYLTIPTTAYESYKKDFIKSHTLDSKEAPNYWLRSYSVKWNLDEHILSITIDKETPNHQFQVAYTDSIDATTTHLISLNCKQRDKLSELVMIEFCYKLACKNPTIDPIAICNSYMSQLRMMAVSLGYCFFDEDWEFQKRFLRGKVKYKDIVTYYNIDHHRFYKHAFLVKAKEDGNYKPDIYSKGKIKTEAIFLLFEDDQKRVKLCNTEKQFDESIGEEDYYDFVAMWLAPNKLIPELQEIFKSPKDKKGWSDISFAEFIELSDRLKKYPMGQNEKSDHYYY